MIIEKFRTTLPDFYILVDQIMVSSSLVPEVLYRAKTALGPDVMDPTI